MSISAFTVRFFSCDSSASSSFTLSSRSLFSMSSTSRSASRFSASSCAAASPFWSLAKEVDSSSSLFLICEALCSRRLRSSVSCFSCAPACFSLSTTCNSLLSISFSRSWSFFCLDFVCTMASFTLASFSFNEASVPLILASRAESASFSLFNSSLRFFMRFCSADRCLSFCPILSAASFFSLPNFSASTRTLSCCSFKASRSCSRMLLSLATRNRSSASFSCPVFRVVRPVCMADMFI
mmetsp:Transcript_42021/g.70129  ORF Transcript_42021/g.70129 Transcript_42021/m.70129 type:complete len:239 (+) Transcript_42021:295-1011(+)